MFITGVYKESNKLEVKRRYRVGTSIGKNAIILSASKVVLMGLSMLISMMLARFRTLEEYGTYSQIIMVINLVTTIFILGLPNSINYFLAKAKDDKEKRKFLSNYYTITTIISVGVGIALFLATPIIVRYFDNPLITKLSYILAIVPWSNIMLSTIDNIYIIYNKTKNIVVFRFLNLALTMTLIILAEVFNMNFYVYMFLYAISNGIFAFSIYYVVYKLAGGLQISLDRKLVRDIFIFSIPMGLASIVGTINIQMDQFIISTLFSTEEYAIFSIASKEIPITIIATSITAVLLPQVIRLLEKDKKDRVLAIWGSATALAYMLICFCVTALVVFAPDVIRILYSDKYLAGVEVFRIYSLVLLLRCTYFGMILNAKGKTKFILYSSIMALILNIVLNIILYYMFGFIGPAIATFISQLIINLAQLLFTTKVLKVNFKEIFPWKNIFYVSMINMLLAAIWIMSKNLLLLDQAIGSICETILIGLVGVVLYISIMRKNMIKQWNKLNEGDSQYD